ncbi:potassium channel family protein [Streptomyces sp. GC420]|uniref:potassium channel family protein n=1 Tax=Streptomyces sp. GC420 TaxID=2697568 RepID=UPI0014152E8A|nr:potassium channel family protein [Streptomyces sp. GC420]NBM20441.1 two pore domain potassium channel family protein [Streptomyces sp. GC420]
MPSRATVIATVRTVFITTGLILAYYLIPMDEEFTVGTTVGLVVGLLAVAVFFVWQIRMIERSSSPRLRAVETVASVLPLFLLLFATAYHLLERAEQGSFTEPLSRTDALYFALSTFSTVGFGDITASSETARVMTMLQMAGGLLIFGLAARVMVNAVQAGLRRRQTDAG